MRLLRIFDILNSMRIAIYHRVSTLDQNPELARDELNRYAARIGGEVALDVEETASGALNNRPGLQRVLKAARTGKVDAVLVWKLDRFGRSALDVLANIRALSDAGVRFVATSQGLDVKPDGDAMSRLMLTVLAAVAEFERDLIRDRTKLGLRRAVAQGKKLGRPRRAVDMEVVGHLRRKGLTWRAIGDHLGIPESTIRAAHTKN